MGLSRTYTLAVTTTGTAGSATGSAQTEITITGFVDAVNVDYHASAPNTTDVVVSEDATDGLDQTILTLANANTDATKYPSRLRDDAAGSPASGAYERFWIDGVLKVAVAQSDALTNAVVVKIRVIEED